MIPFIPGRGKIAQYDTDMYDANYHMYVKCN